MMPSYHIISEVTNFGTLSNIVSFDNFEKMGFPSHTLFTQFKKKYLTILREKLPVDHIVEVSGNFIK